MFDFKSHYAIVKSVIQSKAKEEHKPSLDNKPSMATYAKAKFIGMDDDLACYQLDFTL